MAGVCLKPDECQARRLGILIIRIYLRVIDRNLCCCSSRIERDAPTASHGERRVRRERRAGIDEAVHSSAYNVEFTVFVDTE